MRNLTMSKWLLVVTFHLAMIVANVAAFFVLPFVLPWYAWVPLCTLIFRLMTSTERCLVTDLENRYRERLGWPRVRGFVGHYLIRPPRRVYRKLLARPAKVG